ncbi:MAG: hypothetical protein QMD94_05340 [Candidatus Omnitrophota bacterium]|nr:hypothetical protein [Candidatus Omnitrophota bacterium]
MDKKEIYEHLANIYLDASSKKKKKNRHKPRFLKPLFLVSVFLIFSLCSALYLSFNKNKRLFASQIALVLLQDAAKINFNFDPAKKEIFSLNLSQLNLSHYKEIGFSLKKARFTDKIALKVEFTNAYKEISEIYITDIPDRWKDYKMKLSDFKKIGDWSKISNLSFVVEEWNAKEKHGVVYIDNIRLLK